MIPFSIEDGGRVVEESTGDLLFCAVQNVVDPQSGARRSPFLFASVGDPLAVMRPLNRDLVGTRIAIELLELALFQRVKEHGPGLVAEVDPLRIRRP